MIRSIQHLEMIEMLLNTLEVERHVRRPLVVEIIGELSASSHFAAARRSAKRLLERLERGPMTNDELTRAVRDVRGKVARFRTTLGPSTAGVLTESRPQSPRDARQVFV